MAERSEVELETRLAKQDIFESPGSFVEQTSVTDGGIYERFEDIRVEYSNTDSDTLGDWIYFPKDGYDGDNQLRERIVAGVEDAIGRIVRPEAVVFTSELPKTRSGKIMRRLLEDVANGDDFGNTSTLWNPEIVHEIKAKVCGGAN